MAFQPAPNTGAVGSIFTLMARADAAPVFSVYICTASGPCLWAGLSDMLPSDAEQRALILGISISVYYAFSELGSDIAITRLSWLLL